MRYTTALALMLLTLPLLAGSATATPTVSFKLRAVPIPGFAHTGNFLGAGTDVKLDLTIGGSEYFDSPPPLIGGRFYVPGGAVVHSEGFPTCPEARLLADGPSVCPKGSKAGPIGSLLGTITFGRQRVDETAELISFFRPGGGFEYYGYGHTPAIVEAVANGRLLRSGSGEFGLEEEEHIPIIETVPEGPDASIRSLTGTFGGAMRSHGKTQYYLRLPRRCPVGGFPLKWEAIFAEDGDPTKPETVTTYDRAPCPRR